MSIITRTCTRCKTDRPLDDFYIEAERRHAARYGYKKSTKHCRYCAKEKMDARRKPRVDYIEEIKRESGCVDCGFHPEVLAVLEFDHRDPLEKKHHVSHIMHRGTWEDFVAEIKKCDIVCANCHRVRTIKSKQLGRHFGASRDSKARMYQDMANGLGHLWTEAAMEIHAVKTAAGMDPLF